MPTRVLVGAGILAALVLAGLLSVHASRDPDGLQRVTEQQGLSGTAGDQRSAPGFVPDDARLAGVVGTLVVLVLVSGTTYLVRRRPAQG